MKKRVTILELMVATALVAIVFIGMLYVFGSSSELATDQGERLQLRSRLMETQRRLVRELDEGRMDLLSVLTLASPDASPRDKAIVYASARDANGQVKLQGPFQKYQRAIVVAPYTRPDGGVELRRHEVPADSRAWPVKLTNSTATSLAIEGASGGQWSISRSGGVLLLDSLDAFGARVTQTGVVELKLAVRHGEVHEKSDITLRISH